MLRVLLVGNYVQDRQPSMLGFACFMQDGLRQAGCDVRMADPPVIFGRLSRILPPMHKWIAYMDKFLVFPLLLRRDTSWADVVHICDHSNAVYIPKRKCVPYIVTCHDLLAVRGSLGEQTDCPASSLGKRLQQWIVRGLTRADAIACVSSPTLADVTRLIHGHRPTQVIPLGLRQNLKPLVKKDGLEKLKTIRGLDLNRPFILHVGSSHRRKNREAVLRVFAKVATRIDVQLVFVGKPLEPEQEKLAERLAVAVHVIQTGAVSNEVLAALYGHALVFFFPSRFEGFGWPIVEAQSCGCPVLSSNRPPLPEVAGDGALTRDIEDEDGFADDIVRLSADADMRSILIAQGLQNVRRYEPETIIRTYLLLYERVLNSGVDGERTFVPAHKAAMLSEALPE